MPGLCTAKSKRNKSKAKSTVKVIKVQNTKESELTRLSTKRGNTPPKQSAHTKRLTQDCSTKANSRSKIRSSLTKESDSQLAISLDSQNRCTVWSPRAYRTSVPHFHQNQQLTSYCQIVSPSNTVYSEHSNAPKCRNSSFASILTQTEHLLRYYNKKLVDARKRIRRLQADNRMLRRKTSLTSLNAAVRYN